MASFTALESWVLSELLMMVFLWLQPKHRF